MKTLYQRGRGVSPWPLRTRIKVALWHLVWLFLFRPTPRICNAFRLMILRIFGARISGSPYVSPSVRVWLPENLTLYHGAAIGDRADIYNLAHVTIGPRSTVAQDVLLCAGSHDFSLEHLPVQIGEIFIGPDAFLCIRSMVLPGVRIGKAAIIGAGAVVSRDIADNKLAVGVPARAIKDRQRNRS